MNLPLFPVPKWIQSSDKLIALKWFTYLSISNHSKPAQRPTIPEHFSIGEDCGLQTSQAATDLGTETEFVITLTRCGQPDKPENLPGWEGFHALISQASVPLKRVGFLPVIPSPVTDYSTVYQALKNFQAVLKQLHEPILPVFCDEGVFHAVADIVLHKEAKFSDLSWKCSI